MTFMQRADAAVVGSHPSTATPVRTTNATIAMLNLHAQIEGLELQAAHAQLTNRQLVDLLDALALRGQILGRVADHERAALLAEPLADTGSADGVLVLARARTRACLHRFAEPSLTSTWPRVTASVTAKSTQSEPRSSRRSGATTRR
jgi:hypothetical protein